MSALRSAASAFAQSISRGTRASSSTTAFRTYATAQKIQTNYDTRVEQIDEGTEIRRYDGRGVPRLNSTRRRVSIHHKHLWRKGPFRALTIPKRKKGGRDETGQISTRFIGGGFKRRLRTVDFWRLYPGVHDVVRIEFDPGRSAHIALIRRRDAISKQGLKQRAKESTFHVPLQAESSVISGWSYIVAPDGLRAGDTVQSFRRSVPNGFVDGWNNDPDKAEQITPRTLGLLRTATLKPGNVLPLYLIPPGQVIHNISFDPDGKAKAARSAGCSAQVVAHHSKNGDPLGGLEVLAMGSRYDEFGKLSKQEGTVLVKMSSGEVRKFSPGAVATIGTVSNKEWKQINLGKAGRARNLGRRPSVRGVAKNAVDHPHGGGKGKGKGGKQAHSYTGKVTRGVKTRRPFPADKNGNRAVVTERPRGIHAGDKKRK